MENVKQAIESMSAKRLPRWSELPDLDIYMEQVISLIDRYLEGLPSFDCKGLTASMVNNYVKSDIIPAPHKKKYNRVHLAHLIIICTLKTVMPISQVAELIRAKISSGNSYEHLYDCFCDYFERVNTSVLKAANEAAENLSTVEDMIFLSALRAHAEQSAALMLMSDKGVTA